MKPLIGFIAIHGKICVAVFVLLSAYGLTFTMDKIREKILGGEEKRKRMLVRFIEHLSEHIS